MSFEDKIKKWVHLDNQLKVINDKVKEIKQERDNVEGQIIEYVDTNHLNNATAKITGGKLKFVETKQTSPLTLKYIKECLSECIETEQQVDLILNYIKDNREIKLSKDIKRTYDKE
jgi:hypothetical protein